MQILPGQFFLNAMLLLSFFKKIAPLMGLSIGLANFFKF